MKISVFGLGKLGAPLAAVLASKGHDVIGVDVNAFAVEQVNRGRAPVAETGLAELLWQHRSRLSATTDGYQAVLESDVVFIVVATPSEPWGGFSLRYVREVAGAVGQALRDSPRYRLIVLTSTVMPGSTGGELQAELERVSGRRCGPDFGLCYNPEFIALGSVLHDMRHPDLVLIGESDPEAGRQLASLYEELCENRPPIARMNFVNAELAKLSINTFVTTRISYANMLARICERLPGADVDVVTKAIGLDSRIGGKYLRGTTQYGGPCFPRDNRAMAAMAKVLGTPAALAEATDEINRQQSSHLARVIRARLPENGCVGILGLSYKPHTDVVEASAGMSLAKELSRQEITARVYDPQAMQAARAVLGDRVQYAESLKDCARNCDCLVITVAWDEFRELDPEDLRRAEGRVLVFDCWRLLDPQRFAEVAVCLAPGLGPPEAGRVAAQGTLPVQAPLPRTGGEQLGRAA
ncbi:MAG: nucleotide sugar dehydrogenase [Thermoguttaceae bacterium]|jgi:UDPglucose 6-dehydrogenase